MLCAKFQKDLSIKKEGVRKWNFARFPFKIYFGRIVYIATGFWCPFLRNHSVITHFCRFMLAFILVLTGEICHQRKPGIPDNGARKSKIYHTQDWRLVVISEAITNGCLVFDVLGMILNTAHFKGFQSKLAEYANIKMIVNYFYSNK